MERAVGCECPPPPRATESADRPSSQSESEAVIKAERSENEPISKLQEETVKHVHHKE